MNQNITPIEDTMLTATKEKKPLCVWSIIAFVVSVVSILAYGLVIGEKIRALVPVWLVLGVVSVFLPAIAKKIRISKDKSGKGFETAAIVFAGFAFYSIVFVMTKVPLFVGYLGWVAGGLIYKYVGRGNK